MGRGAAWGDVEAGHLAKAWVTVSQDPIFGIEQTSQRFYQKMYDLFISFKPNVACGKSYNARGIKAARSKFESIAADVQKFKISTREVRAFQPTGTNENQNLSMAIARHIGKTETVTYETKDLSRDEWPNHLAYIELKMLPKFRDDIDESERSRSVTEEAQPADVEENASESCENREPPSPSSARKRNQEVRGGFEGRKKAKMNQARKRYNEIALRNSSTIAASMKRRTELMEEANALQVFSPQNCESEQDRADRAEFLRLTRKAHLKRLRESLLELNANDAILNLTVPPLPPQSHEPPLPAQTSTTVPGTTSSSPLGDDEREPPTPPLSPRGV